MTQCKYKKTDGTQCKEETLPDSSKGYCIFHEELENKDVADCMKRFYDKIRKGETDFEGYILNSVNLSIEGIERIGNNDNEYIIFTNSTFFGNTIFDTVKFSGEIIYFSNAKFLGDVSFKDATFFGITDFDDNKISENISFNDTEFYELVSFNDTEFSKDASFEDAKFLNNVLFIKAKFLKFSNFKNATFSTYAASFHNVEFLGGVSFEFANFIGNAEFKYVIFSEEAIFSNAHFSRYVDFDSSTFLKDAFFINTKFSDAYFRHVKFYGNTYFYKSTFSIVADFTNSYFEKKGTFNKATINFSIFCDAELRHVFFDDVDLSRVLFTGAILEDTYLSNANFYDKTIWEEKEAKYGRKRCSICSQIVFFPSEYILKIENFLRNISPYLIKNKNLIKFVMILQNIINIPLIKPIKCIICGAKFTEKNMGKNEDYEKIQELMTRDYSGKAEDNKEYRNHRELYSKAEEVYRKIKLSLQNEGEYEFAGDFYYREMKMRRKKKFHDTKFGYWFFSHLYSKICGYGEKPIRVILAALLIILGYAFLYHHFQAITTELISQNIGFSEALYFSIVTFTTLGYGDYHPLPSYQHLATTEALIGAFMIALFVLVFGRKMLR